MRVVDVNYLHWHFAQPQHAQAVDEVRIALPETEVFASCQSLEKTNCARTSEG
jgi:hypothetical protein